MLDPLLLKVISISFGLMFLMAAVHKLASPARFRTELADYRVMPMAMVPAMSSLLPILEAGLGLGWLLTPSIGALPAATALLLLAYTTGIVVNLLRGRVHISCGCGFGRAGASGDTLSHGIVARNGVLIGAAVLASIPVQPRPLGVLDYFSLVAALLVCLFLFAAGNQLIRNEAAIGSWRRRTASND